MSWPEEPETSHTLQNWHLKVQQDATAASPYENANISVYGFFYLELLSPDSSCSRGQVMDQQFEEPANQWSLVFDRRQIRLHPSWWCSLCLLLEKTLFFWLLYYLLFKCMTDMTVTAMPQRFCEFSAQNGCEHLTLCRRHCCVGYMCFFPSGGSQSTERRERGACCPRACELLINAALPQQVYSDNLTWWQKCQHESFSLTDLSWNRGQGCLLLNCVPNLS